MFNIKSLTTLTSGLVVFGQLSESDNVYRITPSAAATITLPAAASETGRCIRILTGTNNYTVTVNTKAGDFIAFSGNAGTATSVSNTSISYANISFVSMDATVWQVLDVSGTFADFI